MPTTKRAATTKLAPGEHSIERCAITRKPNGSYVMSWTYRDRDGVLQEVRTVGKTKGAVRTNAYRRFEVRMSASADKKWTIDSKLGDYIEAVSRPLIESGTLRTNTRLRYRYSLKHLIGDCPGHKHKYALGQYTLGNGTRLRTLENCLVEIAQLHGGESARQARNVLGTYVLDQLIRDEVIEHNPLRGVKMDLSSTKQVSRRGGQALTRAEYDRVLEHLLVLDPAEGVPVRQSGRWSYEARVQARRNTIDMMLLQMTTGLRVAEVASLRWDMVEVDDNHTMQITVTTELSKTHRARTVPVLDPRVSERLLARRNRTQGTGYVIGSPTDPHQQWDMAHLRKKAALLYPEVAAACNVPLLRTARTHVWRTTLNTLLNGSVTDSTRAAFFGHDTTVNRSSYTDTTDTSAMVSAYRGLRAVS